MRLTVLAAAAAAALTAVPAGATELSLGATGSMAVSSTGGVCASVTLPGLFTGQLTGVGAGLKVGRSQSVQPGAPILVAVPFVASGSFSTCAGGIGFTPGTGKAVYTLTASGAGGDYVEVLECTFHWGVSCH